MGRLLTLLNPYRFAGGGGGGGGGGTATGFITTLPSLSGYSLDIQVGYEFTADANMTLTKLRIYRWTSESDEVLRIWRVSDQAELGSVTVTPVADAWAEGTLGSSVSLVSGSNYVITARTPVGNTRGIYRGSISGFTFDSNITVVQGRTESGDTFPTSTSDTYIFGIPDGMYT